MLGQGVVYAKRSNGQRLRLDLDSSEKNVNSSQLDKIIIRNKKMNDLSLKYFNKIVNTVIQSIYLNKNSVDFYYNYYDLINDRIGKPHGLLNEFMYEMSYEYSEYNKIDENGNPITFKSLFGNNFKWTLKGKNKMILTW